jgi:hypothetical protein
MRDLEQHFRALLEAQLSDDTRILTSAEAGEVTLLVTWRLRNDPGRPHKRSRLIRIVLAREALQDYRRGSAGARLASARRFVAWIRQQLQVFDPDHDAALGVQPPGVVWPIDTITLNG